MITNVNPAERTVTVVMQNCDVEDIMNRQTAIIELVKYYRYADFGSIADETIVPALDLL